MSDRGTLERLLILAYEHPDYSGSAVGQFEAYVNPNEITIAYEMEYDSAQGSGTIVQVSSQGGRMADPASPPTARRSSRSRDSPRPSPGRLRRSAYVC